MPALETLESLSGNLVEELDRRINAEISELGTLKRRVLEFVSAMHGIPGVREELQTRAVWIETRCAEGSDYNRAATAALAIPDAPEGRNPAGIAFAALSRRHGQTGGPLYLAELIEIREQVNRVMRGFPRDADGSEVPRNADGTVALNDNGTVARNNDGSLTKSAGLFRAWLKACNAIIIGACSVEPDGSRHLQHLWEVASGDADLSQVISRHACESMKAATKSLLTWAARKLAEIEPPVSNTETPEGHGTTDSGQFEFRRVSKSAYHICGFGETYHASGFLGFGDIFRIIRSPKGRVSIDELNGTDDRMKNDVRSRQPVFTEEAKQQNGRKLKSLMADRDAAKERGDVAEQEKFQLEIDRLTEFMEAARGIGGKDRDLNNLADKIRSKISVRIQRACEKLASEGMPTLSEHFTNSISSESGEFIYRPAGMNPNWIS